MLADCYIATFVVGAYRNPRASSVDASLLSETYVIPCASS